MAKKVKKAAEQPTVQTAPQVNPAAQPAEIQELRDQLLRKQNLIFQHQQLLDRFSRVSNSCAPGKIKDLLAAIESGEITTKKQCFARFRRQLAYFRGEIQRMESVRKGEMLALLDQLKSVR